MYSCRKCKHREVGIEGEYQGSYRSYRRRRGERRNGSNRPTGCNRSSGACRGKRQYWSNRSTGSRRSERRYWYQREQMEYRHCHYGDIDHCSRVFRHRHHGCTGK